MKWVETICLSLVTAAVCFFLFEGALAVRETRIKIDQVAGQAQGTLLDISRTAQITAGTMNQARDTLRATAADNKRLAANSAAATATLNADLVKFGKVLDQAGFTIDNIDIETSSLSRHLDATLADAEIGIHTAQPGIANLVRASQGAADTINDPAIHAMLANLQETSSQAAQTSANIQMTTFDLRQFVHRETAPVRGTWNVIKQVLKDFAGPAAEVATAIK